MRASIFALSSAPLPEKAAPSVWSAFSCPLVCRDLLRGAAAGGIVAHFACVLDGERRGPQEEGAEQDEEDRAGDGHCSAYRQRRRRGLEPKDRFSTSGRRPAARRRSATRRGASHRPAPGGRSTARGSARPGAPAPPGLPPRARRRARPSARAVWARLRTRGPRPSRAVRRRVSSRAASAASSAVSGARPTEVAFTSRSVGPGVSAWATPSSAASAAARPRVRFHTATSAPASPQRPHGGPARAPGAQHQRAPARHRLLERGEQAAGVGVVGPDATVGEAERVGRADRLGGRAHLVGQVKRRELVRDRHVGAHVPRGGQRPDRLREQLRLHRQLHVAPVEAELGERPRSS